MTRASTATAARRCVSRRDDRVVTRRSLGPARLGSRSCSPPKNRPAAAPAGGRLGQAGRLLDRGGAGGDAVGERDRRAVGRAGQRLGRLDRDQLALLGRGRDLGRLEGDRPVAAGAVGRDEAVVEMLHRRLRVERDHRVLELVRAEPGDQVRRGEDDRVADRHLAAPDVRLDLGGGQPAVPVRVGQGRQTRLPDEVGLGRADRDDVQLVAPDDGHGHPDRAVRLVPGEPVALVAELLVGGLDRLLEADDDPGRLVVVVLLADRVRDELGHLAEARPGVRPVTSR